MSVEYRAQVVYGWVIDTRTEIGALDKKTFEELKDNETLILQNDFDSNSNYIYQLSGYSAYAYEDQIVAIDETILDSSPEEIHKFYELFPNRHDAPQLLLMLRID